MHMRKSQAIKISASAHIFWLAHGAKRRPLVKVEPLVKVKFLVNVEPLVEVEPLVKVEPDPGPCCRTGPGPGEQAAYDWSKSSHWSKPSRWPESKASQDPDPSWCPDALAAEPRRLCGARASRAQVSSSGSRLPGETPHSRPQASWRGAAEKSAWRPRPPRGHVWHRPGASLPAPRLLAGSRETPRRRGPRGRGVGAAAAAARRFHRRPNRPLERPLD